MAIYWTVFVLIVVCTAVHAQPPGANTTVPGVVRSSAELSCPEGWLSDNNNCYGINIDSLNWFQAIAACNSYSSHVIQVDSEEKSSFLRTTMTDLNIDSLWTGGTSRLHEGAWQWYPSMDGIAQYTKWATGQPSNPQSNRCLEIRADLNYEWNASPCDSSMRYICEKNMTPQ